MCIISCMANAVWVGISLASVFCSLTKHWWSKRSVQSGVHMCWLVIIMPYIVASYYPLKMYTEKEMFFITFLWWMRYGCIHLTQNWNGIVLISGPPSHHRRRGWHNVICVTLKVMHIMFFPCKWIVLGHLVTPLTNTNGTYYTVLCVLSYNLPSIRSNQYCWNVVWFLSVTVQYPFVIIMCRTFCRLGFGRCWHALILIYSSVITLYFLEMRSHFRVMVWICRNQVQVITSL
jgi:hypothetical protein